MDLNQLQQVYDENRDRYFEEWKEFLKFESISTDPQYKDGCLQCAKWLSNHLQGIGLKSEILDTPGLPVVYGEYAGPEGSPVVSFYGHYDVQPVDPIELWKSPPFEAEIRENRMYARGAVDNKGQVFFFLKALETLIKADSLPCTVKLFIEGEEEHGSEGISKSLEPWKDRLRSEYLMVCDTGTPKKGVGAVMMGLRGIIGADFELGGLTGDMHSGTFGGVVPNPATELSRMITTLHDEKREIQIEGFYEGVESATEREKEVLAAIPMDWKEFEENFGVGTHGGEQQFSPFERSGLRPTVEINGLYSGYQGAGQKTIIPSKATAKVTCRLVAGQDPARCLELLVRHMEKYTPEGLKLTVKNQVIGGAALKVPLDSPGVKKVSAVLKEISEVDPIYLWEGGSIPVVADMAKVAEAEPLLVGFALPEDGMHSPNESFDLDQFRMGYLYASRFLSELSS